MAALQHSKYRHAFTDEPKQQSDKYCDLPKPQESPEAKIVTASSKWVAMAKVGGGGPVVIKNLGQLGRGRTQTPILNNHRGKVTDLAFSPFNPDLLITGSDDTSIHVTCLYGPEGKVPPEDMSEDDRQPGIHQDLVGTGTELYALTGHEKKVSFVAPHTTSDNILASSSWDKTVRLWDMSTQQEVACNNSHPHSTFCLEWNRNGSLLGTTCKDHMMRLYDPRTSEDPQAVEIFRSSKCSKLFWIAKHNWIGVFGFTKESQRQLKVYDLKNMSQPLHTEQLDKTSSIVFPTWDDETDLLWTWSKGDGTMAFAEITTKHGFTYKNLGTHRSSVPTKGGCFIPKVALETEKCEVARFLKLTNNPTEIVPLSFTVPRKVQGFQEDLFPPSPGTEAAQSGADYLEGKDVEPKLTSMDPSTLAAAKGKKVVVPKTYAELQQENEELKARVAELEAQLGTN